MVEVSGQGLNDAQFYVADFYDGVADQDRQRLEENGKILVFTNGKKGYFTDRDTAKLMAEGDRPKHSHSH